MSEHRFSVPNPDGSEYSLCEFCNEERAYRPILQGPCIPKEKPAHRDCRPEWGVCVEYGPACAKEVGP